jgi:hypothetical protein
MDLQDTTLSKLLQHLRPFDICVGSYQLLQTASLNIVPTRYMNLGIETSSGMLQYLQQLYHCVCSYQPHWITKLNTPPVRCTISRHSQHLRSGVVFDRNLIDCLNLKVKQKQKSKKKGKSKKQKKITTAKQRP